MLYLDRNENHFGPAPEIYSIIKETDPELLTTYSRDYTRGIKSRLSAELGNSFGVSEKQVLLGYGSEDLLKQIVHCYLKPGDVMMVPQYSWWYYKAVAREVHGHVVEYPVHINRNTFAYDIDEIATAIRKEKPTLLFFASPNNPTGNSLAERHLEHILKEFPHLLVIVDEAYMGFSDKRMDGNPRLVNTYHTLAVLRTFSKLHALAGLRIGFGVVGTAYRELITYSNRYLGFNQLSEQCAIAAWKNDAYYRTIGTIVSSERQRYYDLFSIADGYTAFRSDANFLLVQFPGEHKNRFMQHMRAAGIAIKFFDEPLLEFYTRITIGTPEENSRLLDVLMTYLSAYVSITSIEKNLK